MQRRRRQIQPTDLKAKAVGVVMRELREQAGYSQERLSDECGFDRTYISRVERGIINPTVSRLWKIADALETPLSQFAKRPRRRCHPQHHPGKQIHGRRKHLEPWGRAGGQRQ
jgi:transcriptional regulator with XRE-family HTH domain